jgi:hypothetical protein
MEKRSQGNILKTNKKDGYGKHTWPDKSYYDGEWFEDKVNLYILLIKRLMGPEN